MLLVICWCDASSDLKPTYLRSRRRWTEGDGGLHGRWTRCISLIRDDVGLVSCKSTAVCRGVALGGARCSRRDLFGDGAGFERGLYLRYRRCWRLIENG